MVLGTAECRGVALGCVVHPRGYVEAVIANPEPAGVSGVRDERRQGGELGDCTFGADLSRRPQKRAQF